LTAQSAKIISRPSVNRIRKKRRGRADTVL
jgi:hypothetical protein